MRSFLLVTLLGLAAPVSTAFACEGGKCDDKHCDMPAATATAPVPTGSTTVNLKVEGMKCGECSGKVQTALMAVSGVTVANVNAAAGTAEVGYDAAKTNPDAMIAAVNATGHFKASKN